MALLQLISLKLSVMKKPLLFIIFILYCFSGFAQPDKIWATYLGDGAGVFNVPSQILYDSSGFIYVTGSTADDNLATPNSFKEQKTLLIESYLAKFDTLGNRIWTTYLGNNNMYVPNLPNIALDPFGNILIIGATKGSQDMMGTPGTYRPVLSPVTDSFYTVYYLNKFDSNGQRLWGTYLGSTNSDTSSNIPSRITTDHAGNILICGTVSTGGSVQTPFPSSSAYMTNSPSSSHNAFLMKFDSTGNLIWGTYYGDVGDDAGLYVACDTGNNIYMVGATKSDNNIASTGAYYPERVDQTYESFIVKFNPNGSRLWATYTNGLEVKGGIVVNKENDFYLSGFTNRDTGIATSGTHQTDFADTLDVFLSKWNKDGQRLWGTYYGGSGLETGGNWNQVAGVFPSSGSLLDLTTNISLDVDQNVLIVGYTRSDEQIKRGCTYPDMIQHKRAEGFMAKFYPDGNIMWGSYYEPRLHSVACSDKGTSFYTLSETTRDSLATAGAFQEEKIIGASTAFITKMEGNYICPEITVSIQNNNGTLSIDPFYQDLQWYKNGEPITNANFNTYPTQDTGTYWVTFKNECDCPYISDSVWVNKITSINIVDQHKYEINLYPNPNRGKFQIQADIKSSNANIHLIITDVFGKERWRSTLIMKEMPFKHTINGQQLKSGVYFLHVRWEGGKKVLKFSVQN